MIHSSRRDRNARTIAEVLAMIADAHPPEPHQAHPAIESEEWLFESATEFSEALEKYFSARASRIKRAHQ